MEFAQILDIMEKNNISQKQLAEALGVGQQKVSDWKKGTISSWNKRLPEIASFLRVSMDELAGNKKSPADMTIDEAKKELYEIAKRLSPENYNRLLDQARLLQAVEQKKEDE